MNNTYNIFLDDERNPEEVIWVQLPDVKWHVITSYEKFIDIISNFGLPENISFDHDLGLNSIGDGSHCARFLAEYCIENHLPIPKYYIHSMNGIGRKNIISILESAKKILDKNAETRDAVDGEN